eukprot:10184589-Karenia_brevis.AAC.1
MAALDIPDMPDASHTDPLKHNDPWKGQKLPTPPPQVAANPWQNMPAAKRPHADVASGSASSGSNGAFVTQQEYSDGLHSLRDKLLSSMQKSMATLNVDLSSNVSETVMDLSAKVEKRVAGVEKHQAVQDARIDSHETTIAQLQQQVGALSSQHMAASEQLRALQAQQTASAAAAIHTTHRMEQMQQAVRAEVQSREESDLDISYKGPPSATILRLHINETPVPKTEVEKAVITWFAAVIPRDQWRLEGPEEAKRFTIRFLAFPRSAALHVKEALDLLRPEKADDPWVDLFALKDGKSYKIFVNRDESEQQQRLQMLQRKVKEACKILYPTLQLATPKPLFHASREMQAMC